MTGLAAARAGLVIWSGRRPLTLGLLAAFLGPLLMLPIVLTAVLPGAPSAHALQAPVAGGHLTQPFGCTTHAFEPWSADCPTRHFHSGIDLAAAEKTPVMAAERGWVTVNRDPEGYGLYILVAHGTRLSTLYAHLSSAFVGSGSWVQSGQPIGLIGSTGNSTGPHLHFEVRLGDVPVDPAPYLLVDRWR